MSTEVDNTLTYGIEIDYKHTSCWCKVKKRLEAMKTPGTLAELAARAIPSYWDEEDEEWKKDIDEEAIPKDILDTIRELGSVPLARWDYRKRLSCMDCGENNVRCFPTATAVEAISKVLGTDDHGLKLTGFHGHHDDADPNSVHLSYVLHSEKHCHEIDCFDSRENSVNAFRLPSLNMSAEEKKRTDSQMVQVMRAFGLHPKGNSTEPSWLLMTECTYWAF